MSTPAGKRPCEQCQVCCWALWVEELDSPAGEPCRHQCATGCGIFGQPERPPVCRGFWCAYASDNPQVPERPDRCGVLVWVADGEIRMRELWPGALDADWVHAALEVWPHDRIVMERVQPSAIETVQRLLNQRGSAS